MPPASARSMVATTRRLYQFSENDPYRERAVSLARTFAPEIEKNLGVPVPEWVLKTDAYIIGQREFFTFKLLQLLEQTGVRPACLDWKVIHPLIQKFTGSSYDIGWWNEVGAIRLPEVRSARSFEDLFREACFETAVVKRCGGLLLTEQLVIDLDRFSPSPANLDLKLNLEEMIRHEMIHIAHRNRFPEQFSLRSGNTSSADPAFMRQYIEGITCYYTHLFAPRPPLWTVEQPNEPPASWNLPYSFSGYQEGAVFPIDVHDTYLGSGTNLTSPRLVRCEGTAFRVYLLHPYWQGENFVSLVAHQVDNAFAYITADPPQSMDELAHPDQYLQRRAQIGADSTEVTRPQPSWLKRFLNLIGRSEVSC